MSEEKSSSLSDIGASIILGQYHLGAIGIKALAYTQYGSPDVLRRQKGEKPVLKDDEVLIKVHATTVNRTDCATIRAMLGTWAACKPANR